MEKSKLGGSIGNYPILGKALIQEEWCHVLIVGEGLIGTVGKSFIYKDALGVGNSEPSDAGQKLWICIARDVIAIPVILGLGVFVEEAGILVGFVHIFQPPLFQEVGLVQKG